MYVFHPQPAQPAFTVHRPSAEDVGGVTKTVHKQPTCRHKARCLVGVILKPQSNSARSSTLQMNSPRLGKVSNWPKVTLQRSNGAQIKAVPILYPYEVP